jgi:uncharacterized membrane protein
MIDPSQPTPSSPRPQPLGAAPQRTLLAWWRTAQVAIVCALLFVKFAADQVLGWITAGLALLIAVVAWWVARQRARATAAESIDSIESPGLTRRALHQIQLLGALCVLFSFAALGCAVAMS